jgi:molybdopterin converting factor small subunit
MDVGMPTDRSAPRLPDDEPSPASTPVVVTLPRALLNLFPDAKPQVALPAATVGEMIDGLDARWPGMRDRLCDSRPAIRRHINVFVDGRRASLETRLAPGAQVFVITAISGG